MGILYRVRQFWRTISIKTDPLEVARAQAMLPPGLSALFNQLQPAEKNHALAMLGRLRAQGETQPDLLTAVLLHDVGKLRYHMNPLERSLVVLVKAVKPEQARHWGTLPDNGWDGLPGWRKAFIVAEQHAGWGVEMVRQVGVSPLVESLIRSHHQPQNDQAGTVENSLLHKLWVVDNQS